MSVSPQVGVEVTLMVDVQGKYWQNRSLAKMRSHADCVTVQ